MSSPRPNILLIICHDLGQHIGCYGVRTVQTPNLDRLAAEGVRFENSFCTAPQCSPSRAGLMCGRYPHATGVLGLVHGGFRWELQPGERHIASLLAELGYRTHMFGTQHVTSYPERLGFHYRAPGNVARKIASDVVSFIENRNSKEPFYAHVGFFEPHRPFDHGNVPPDDSMGVFVPSYLPNDDAARSELAEMQGAIKHVDQQVGLILEALDRKGLAENTITVFTVDHGIPFPRAKCSLYDSGIEVALLMRWPTGVAVAGRVFEELISNVDLLPTLLQAAGISLPANLQGCSFLPLLRSEGYQPRAEVFAEKTYHTYYDPTRAIRTRRHKLIWNFDFVPRIELPSDIIVGATARHMLREFAGYKQPVELYDLQADPWEMNNIAPSAEHAEVRTDLSRQLLRWMRDTGDPLLQGPVSSPAYRKSLEMLEAEVHAPDQDAQRKET